MKKGLIFLIICILVIGGVIHNCKNKENTTINESSSSETTEQNTKVKEVETFMVGNWKHIGTYSGVDKTGKWLNMNANTSLDVNPDGTIIYNRVKGQKTFFSWNANNDGTVSFNSNQTDEIGSYSFTIDSNCIVVIYTSKVIGTVCSYYKKTSLENRVF